MNLMEAGPCHAGTQNEVVSATLMAKNRFVYSIDTLPLILLHVTKLCSWIISPLTIRPSSRKIP
jgi:hypothetical protein